MGEQSPIRTLLQNVMDGELSVDEAVGMAVHPDVASALELQEVVGLSRNLLRASGSNNWPKAIELLCVLRAAIAARPDDPITRRMSAETTLDWIESVKHAVWHTPDEGLFRNACQEGRKLRRRARQERNAPLEADAAFRLGILHLDPYAARQRQDYERVIREWRDRGRYAGTLSAAGRTMPSASTALHRASLYLKLAADGYKGDMRGRSLKALLQARDWLAHSKGAKSDPDQEIADEALDILVGGDDPYPVVGLIGDRILADHPFPEATVAGVVARLSKMKGSGPTAAQLDSLIKLAGITSESSPAGAVQILARTRKLFEEHGDDQIQRGRFVTMIGTLLRIASAGRRAPELGAGPLERQAQEWLDSCRRSRAGVPAELGGLLHLAEKSKEPCREQEAIAALVAWERVAPADAADYSDAVAFELATLWEGVGVNAFNAQDWAASATAYCRAVEAYLKVGMVGQASDDVERAYDVGRRDPGAVVAVVTGLSPLAAQIRQRLGPGVGGVLRRVAQTAIQVAPRQRTDGDLLSHLRELTK